MVWVDLDTKVYHEESDHWYGKAKNGKYMTKDKVKKAERALHRKGMHPEPT